MRVDVVQICGASSSLKSAGNVFVTRFSNLNDNLFVTGGDKTLRVWTIDVANRKVKPEECNLGATKRVIKCIQVNLQIKNFVELGFLNINKLIFIIFAFL